MKMKLLTAAAIAAAVTFGVSAAGNGPAQAQQEFITIGTGGSTGV